MDRFIVGTGRCGSTLLSRMLAQNSRLLSISEFWSVIAREDVFSKGDFDGPQVIELVNRNNQLNDFVMSRSPFLDAGAGHSLRKEVGDYAPKAQAFPALKIFLNNVRSGLGEGQEVEPLYEDAIAFFRGQPRQTLDRHWSDFFVWLTQRFGREAWVERSGLSIEHVGKIIDFYPDARIVHLHRDGLTNALGIRAFRHFVLYASFFADPPSEAEMELALNCTIGSEEDPIFRRMGRDVPSLEDCGRYWSWQVTRGCCDLMRLPPSQRLEVRYEDLVADTPATLSKIAGFLELPKDKDWIARAAQQVDPEAVPDRLSSLEPQVRAALERACQPGQVVLGRAPGNPIEDSLKYARTATEKRAQREARAQHEAGYDKA